MPVLQRTSGISVTTPDAIEVVPASAQRRRAPLVAKFRRGGLKLVDTILLHRTKPSTSKKSRAPDTLHSSVDIHVTLGRNEQAVILLEEAGEYRWMGDGSVLNSRNAALHAAAGVRHARKKRFTIDIGRATAEIVVYVFRGAVNHARGSTTKFVGIPTQQASVRRSTRRRAEKAKGLPTRVAQTPEPEELYLGRKPAAQRREPPNGSAKKKRSVECYFLAEVDAQIVVDEPAPVDVTISREFLRAESGKTASGGGATVEQGTRLTVEIAEHKELRVQGERRMEVGIPEPGSPETVQFKVIGSKAGRGELSIQIRQASIPLVTLWLTPQIAAGRGRSVRKLKGRFELERYPAAEPPLDELRIIESINDGVVSYTFMLDLKSLEIRRQFESTIKGPRDAYVVKVMNDIGDSWIRGQKKSVEHFEDEIRSIGARMFRELLPREMQALLWDRRESIRSVQVFSAEPFIPWELLYLHDTRKDRPPKTNKFLGELGLLRWVYDGYPPAQLRIRRSHVRYLIAQYQDKALRLPEAEAEQQMMQRVFAPQEQPIPSELASLNTVLKKAGAFDLLHVCCHAHAAGEDSSQAQIYINGSLVNDRIAGETLKANTVAESVRLAKSGAEHRPIVVLNACESARPNREFNGMGGFAHAFIKARAGAFIGTHWSVGDAPAFAFVQALYEAFVTKREQPITLSEAVIAARKAARLKNDATWLAYAVYGHPHARVTVE
jgi:hypothetical protein